MKVLVIGGTLFIGRFLVEEAELIRLPFPTAVMVVVKSPDPSMERMAASSKGEAKKAEAR